MTLEEAMAIAEEYMDKPWYKETAIKTVYLLKDIYIFEPLCPDGSRRLGLYNFAVYPNGKVEDLSPATHSLRLRKWHSRAKVIKEF